MKATIFRSVREVQLQYNRFDDNALENISSLNLSEIRVFDISHNQIATIETLIPISKRSHHLQLLNVSYNNISNLETNNWTATLDISNNPIPCRNTAIKHVKVKISYIGKISIIFFSVFPPSQSLAGTVPWDDKTAGSVSVSITSTRTTSISTAPVGHCLTFQTLISQQNVNIQSYP